ncbi:MAG: Arc family DNA-binding protein [Sphingobacteriales bacterium]|nr:MAG: Arc family DNA-binding protein [Sphingobacteriales bacterium]
MADKKNFVLRLNAAMYKALEKWAADDFRSVNSQIEYLLNNALKEQGRLPNPEQKPAGKKEE